MPYLAAPKIPPATPSKAKLPIKAFKYFCDAASSGFTLILLSN
jgi:hypothetical protein